MQRTFGLVSAGIASLLAGGCVIVAGDFDDHNHGYSSGDVMGSVIDSRGVTITARSNGCTDKSYFDVDVDRDDGRYEVSFERTRSDNCRALLRDGVDLTWSNAELGIPDGAAVVVTNRSRS